MEKSSVHFCTQVEGSEQHASNAGTHGTPIMLPCQASRGMRSNASYLRLAEKSVAQLILQSCGWRRSAAIHSVKLIKTITVTTSLTRMLSFTKPAPVEMTAHVALYAPVESMALRRNGGGLRRGRPRSQCGFFVDLDGHYHAITSYWKDNALRIVRLEPPLHSLGIG